MAVPWVVLQLLRLQVLGSVQVAGAKSWPKACVNILPVFVILLLADMSKKYSEQPEQT
jgi:hypothetical protein